MQKAERLMAITLLLQARGKMTAERLADILGVSVRTIYRDVNSLSLAHVPVSMDYGPGGGYFLPPDAIVDQLALTGEEAAVLALGGAVAGGSSLFGGSERLSQALMKREAALPEEFRRDVRIARERVLVDSVAWRRQPILPPFLETVRAALFQERRIAILYPRSDGSRFDWRDVDPFGLVSKAGVWYLVAYCLLRQDFRIFHLNRIQAVEAVDSPIDPQSDFDLATYWDEARTHFEEQIAPIALVLRASSHALSLAPEEWAILEKHDDGSATVRIKLDSIPMAIRHALSHGAEVTVLDPPEVRDAVAAAARSLSERYSTGSTSP